jgi:hypothetical protein
METNMETNMKPNTRVEIAPHYDLWMRGDRYGSVVRTRPDGKVVVWMDKTNRECLFPVEDLVPV